MGKKKETNPNEYIGVCTKVYFRCPSCKHKTIYKNSGVCKGCQKFIFSDEWVCMAHVITDYQQLNLESGGIEG